MKHTESLRLLTRHPITSLFSTSLLALIAFVRPGPDTPIPSAIEWLIIPAHFLTLSVSMLGPRSFSIIAALALLLCIGLDYLLWTVLPRRWTKERGRDAPAQGTVT